MTSFYRMTLAATLFLAAISESRAQALPTPTPLDPPVPALDAPATGTTGGAITPRQDVRPATAEPRADRVYVAKVPPAPILERPPARRPSLRAVWIPGNWEWDAARDDFVWVPGSWQIGPRATTWVAGQWQRDDRGFYWTPGYWAARRGDAVETRFEVRNGAPRQPAWRIEGPPSRQPAEVVDDAPGPDYFYIPGHYRPDGQSVSWKPGMWSREQPGWEWVSARWIRRPDGWDYRPGFWTRDPARATVARRPVTQPEPGTNRADDQAQPPAASVNPSVVNPDAPPPVPLGEEDLDAITARERGVPIGPETPIGVEPVTGMPYYMIRPPAYPYGRNGVVVPGAVPPFVRNLLDRVLP